MKTPLLTKAFSALSDIPAHTLVAIRNDGNVESASGTNSMIIGISSDVAIKAGSICDVVLAGIQEVYASAALGAGDILTSDSKGHALTTSTANHRTVGIALTPAAGAGELVAVLVLPYVR